MQIPILAYFGSFEVVVARFFAPDRDKIRTELKLIGVDFVLRDTGPALAYKRVAIV